MVPAENSGSRHPSGSGAVGGGLVPTAASASSSAVKRQLCLQPVFWFDSNRSLSS